MKGYLDAKQLESYKKADLQKLARELGVSDAGTIKEIAARCAEVEVDVPEEERKAAEEAAAEQAAADARKETAAGGTHEEAQPDKNTGKVTVIVTTRYLDKRLNQIKDEGETFTVDRERAAELVTAKVAKIKD